MNRDQFDSYLTGIIGISVLGALFNLGKIGKRGVRAYILSGAFLMFALGALLLRADANRILIGIVCFVTVCLLIADVILRMGRAPREPGT